jgi:hypothetical protein
LEAPRERLTQKTRWSSSRPYSLFEFEVRFWFLTWCPRLVPGFSSFLPFGSAPFIKMGNKSSGGQRVGGGSSTGNPGGATRQTSEEEKRIARAEAMEKRMAKQKVCYCSELVVLIAPEPIDSHQGAGRKGGKGKGQKSKENWDTYKKLVCRFVELLVVFVSDHFSRGYRMRQVKRKPKSR